MANWDRDPLSALNDIVNDLWGSVAKDDAELEKLRAAARKAADAHEPIPAERLGGDARRTRIVSYPFVREETASVPETEKAEEPAAAEEPAEEKKEPSFEDLWYVADETVDWTEVLTHERPDDGLTDPERWSFLHERASRVLEGDLTAYQEIVDYADPLKDLAPYAADLLVVPASADRVEISFKVLPALMDGKTDEERRRYLAEISVRAARDLMALLPCYEAAVTARGEVAAEDAAPALTVTYTRPMLQKARLQFSDPVALCEQCGGSFGA